MCFGYPRRPKDPEIDLIARFRCAAMINFRKTYYLLFVFHSHIDALLEDLVLPEPKPNAKVMLPLIPLHRADPSVVNWPHTRTARGPFDSVMLPSGAPGAAHNTAPSRLRAADDEEEGLEAAEGAWGEDELELSGEEKFASAEGEESPRRTESDENEEGAGWGEDELELDKELEKVSNVAETSVRTIHVIIFAIVIVDRSHCRRLVCLIRTTGFAAQHWLVTTWRQDSLTPPCDCSMNSSALLTSLP